ncbi:MAG: 50S ribosomal protein L22 [Clostridia bacterium]|jgi:large subunit ribosomal protein L22|nr:50S ribosomal protein L22 [Clostridia bacterium]
MAKRIREKANARRANADKRPHATAKYVRISSSKVKIVADLIRGKSAEEALAILMYTPKAAAPIMEKLLLSAIANGENRENNAMSRGSMYVAEVYANPGPTLKRYVARSRGSASPMLKRTSHITIVLDQK